MRGARVRREDDGRYAVQQRCDACGKPIHGDYGTDDEVCQGGDGPGFFLCNRDECMPNFASMSVEERRALYKRREPKRSRRRS